MRLICRLSIVWLLIGCTSSVKDNQFWYKGNLHTHSYWSDGDEYPEMIMNWYKTNGYNFVGLSDHNILAEGEKWIKVTNSGFYEAGFEKYLQVYGPNWVVHKMDSGRIHVLLKTFREYKPLFEDEKFLILPSEELTMRFESKPIHMNVTNVQKLINPQTGQSVTEIMQNNIDEVMRQRRETGVLMFPHVNHPNFYYGVSVQDIINLHDERFFEVYNGHPLVRNEGDSLHPSTEAMWDLINIAYLKKGQPLIFGLATDDSHNYHEFGLAYSNAGRGWVMVQSNSLSPESLITSLEAGNFYSSTGVQLEEVSCENNTLHVKVKKEKDVAYEIQVIGLNKSDQQPRILKSTADTELNFNLNEDHLFVRAKVTSTKLKANPFREGEFEVAWTQPVIYH